MRLAPLLLALSSAASAHESFDAVWIQPATPLVMQRAIVPLGWTHGLGPWSDLVIEATPYYMQNGVCVGGNGCRDHVFGFIGSAGAALSHPIASAPGWELGLFAGLKAVVAFADETGTAGDPTRDFAFVPGTSYEFGGGLDVGLELHWKPGFYAAFVIGFQYTKAFNYGEYGDGTPNPPSWPVTMMRSWTFSFRDDDWFPLLVPNLNLLRVGWAF
jgi:hypothetical protein